MRVLRVFPRKTTMTPDDAFAFVGDPPLWRPEADEVHISCTFSWDIPKALRLVRAWRQYYANVLFAGPAIGGNYVGEFTPGLYVRHGITFTSRGCNNACPWCLVPEWEGKLRLLSVEPGHIIQDNNLLQCQREHMSRVFEMLKSQPKAAEFKGGLDSTLVDDWVAGQLQQLKIHEVFLAADTWGALEPLREAIGRLSFLKRRQLRCYVLLGFDKSESISRARERLEAVWNIGCLPFAQLFQPSEKEVVYPLEWRRLQREWDRPAAMFANHPRQP